MRGGKDIGTGATVRWAALSALAGLLAACSSGNAPKPAHLTEIAHPIDVRATWTVSVGGTQTAFLRPCVTDRAIYAASAGGDLVRVDPTTGKEVWRVRVPGGIAAGVGCDGVNEAVIGPHGQIRTYDAGGKFRWAVDGSTSVAVTPPLVAHDLVLVRTIDQRLSAYDEDSGGRRWSFQKTPPPLSLRVETELGLSGDVALVGFPRGLLLAVSLANGAPRWEATVSDPKGVTEVERLNDVLGAPVADGADVCAESYQGRIGCFDTYTGEPRWVRPYDAGAGLALIADTVVGVRENGNVDAFSRGSGAGVWHNGALSYRGLTAPAVAGQWAAVGDYEGKIHFLRLDDGKIVGRFSADSALASSPQAWNDGIVIQTVKGQLSLLTPHG